MILQVALLGCPVMFVTRWMKRKYDPEYQGDGLVAKGLFAKVIQLAEAHGSQGIEGFMLESEPGLIEQAEGVGAQLDRGVRVRWLLGPAATEKAKKLREALRA